MSTKGTLTWVSDFGFSGKLTKAKKCILWMDGYDAWCCAFGWGDKAGWGHREFKRTSYGFTLVVPTKTIKLSPNFDTEMRRDTVRERTLEYRKFEAGQLVDLGYTLAWLTPDEHKQVKDYYLKQKAEFEKA